MKGTLCQRKALVAKCNGKECNGWGGDDYEKGENADVSASDRSTRN